MRRICPHVHCRDEEEAYKTTIAEVLAHAKAQGVDIVFDMPNTKRPILTAGDVRRRLKLVPISEKERYFLYVGLTADSDQIEEAVRCWNIFPEVVGLKMFAGRSVGPLAVIEREDQRSVYKYLAEYGYTGLIAVHCERESDMGLVKFDPNCPVSHSLARPKIAEINSVRDQIEFAREAGFKGTLHICHVSCPESVALVQEAKLQGMKITCGVTPHHLLFSTQMQAAMGLGEVMFKVNPPLRDEEDRIALLECVKRGEIDWIETDHAIHAVWEKFGEPFLSGIPSMFFYQRLIDYLLLSGVSEEQIASMTFWNIVKAFSPKLDHLAKDFLVK